MRLAGGDLEKATARVAGRDMANTVADETFSTLSDIFEKETERGTRCPICHELSGYHQGRFARARAILTAMRHGLEDGRS